MVTDVYEIRGEMNTIVTKNSLIIQKNVKKFIIHDKP
jgi:hypothetical protein